MPESAQPPTALRRDRSHTARTAARTRKAEREARVVGLLNRGVSVAEIADREGVSLKRMRNCVREILARRAPQPPAEFLALQVSRLNEALLLSYNEMYNEKTGANYKAIDSVVRIVRELDRYHGFCPAPAGAGRLALAAPLALPPPAAADSDMAPQTVEKTGFGLGDDERLG